METAAPRQSLPWCSSDHTRHLLLHFPMSSTCAVSNCIIYCICAPYSVPLQFHLPTHFTCPRSNCIISVTMSCIYFTVPFTMKYFHSISTVDLCNIKWSETSTVLVNSAQEVFFKKKEHMILIKWHFWTKKDGSCIMLSTAAAPCPVNLCTVQCTLSFFIHSARVGWVYYHTY